MIDIQAIRENLVNKYVGAAEIFYSGITTKDIGKLCDEVERYRTAAADARVRIHKGPIDPITRTRILSALEPIEEDSDD